MKETRLMMGMPITVEITDPEATPGNFNAVFDYFDYVDKKFSPFKKKSELSLINRGKITEEYFSADMADVMKLCAETKRLTGGYFDINHNGVTDTSGLVKGWAIFNAANLLKEAGLRNYYIEAGGDIQTAGLNEQNKPWTVGIRHPFELTKIVKVLKISDRGIATSGNYLRGQHIYNPRNPEKKTDEIVSLTVIGPNIYEADRFATAAYAMGKNGITFIEALAGFEGYMIDHTGLATFTSGFNRFVIKNENNR